MRQGTKREIRKAPALGLRSRLVLGTALATTAFLGGYRGYVRRAFAACAVEGGIYVCRDELTETQTLTGTPLTVTTDDTFSITTTVGNAFTLITPAGIGGLTFTDNNSSNITGATVGISAVNNGSGALSITTNGTVASLGTINPGIFAQNFGTSLTIVANNVNDQILAQNYGSGALSITTTGTLTDPDFAPIFARNYANGTNLTISTIGTVAGTTGINAGNDGTGALSITATDTVTGTSGIGIDASNGGIATGEGPAVYGTNLTLDVAGVQGGSNGIRADNEGEGALTITASGLVSGANGTGIVASNGSSYVGEGGTTRYGTGLTMNVAGVTGGDSGIDAVNAGSGALSITASGLVQGTNGTGILARNGGYAGDDTQFGTNLTIDVAGVTGGSSGIDALNNGTGALSITATDTVTGTSGIGISANSSGGTALTIEAIDVSGGTFGIRAEHYSTGALSITATGTVMGTDNDGIYARTLFDGISSTDLTIEAANVSGGTNGIYAGHTGTGALSITASGLVQGTNGTGIFARNGGGYAGGDYPQFGTNLTIDVAGVTGADSGIRANNYGTGTLFISASGAVTVSGLGGYGADGIRARNSGSDLTINVAGVTGGNAGIRANNYGTGALSITARGAVTANGLYGYGADGIRARNSGTDLTINAAAVSGARSGIDARNAGSGALSIASSGPVVGAGVDGSEGGGDGIFATNAGTGLTINAASVSGAHSGIVALNDGSGALSITASEAVIGEGAVDGSEGGIGGDGIYANNEGTNLTVTAAAVTGAFSGIVALNDGSGSLSIATSGAVTGQGTLGAYYGRYGTGGDGIIARNSGAGSLSITSTGTVTGASGIGIDAVNDGTDLAITAENVRGATTGIVARNLGSGSLSVTATGAVRGQGGPGVYADNESAAANSTTTVATERGASVSGTTAGVELVSGTGRAARVVNAGSIAGTTGILANTAGRVTIVNSGSVAGTSGTAIDLTGVGAGTVNQQGGVVSGNLLLSANSDVVSVQGGIILGSVDLGAADDTVTASGGTIAQNVFGGFGNDTISVAGTAVIGAVQAGAGLDNVTVSGGAVGSVLGGGGADTIDISGGTVGSVIGGDGDDKVTVSGGTIGNGINAETLQLNGGTVHGNITGLSENTLIIQAQNLSLDDGVLFQGTNVVGTITGTDLASGGSQNFAGFSSLTLSGDTASLAFANNAQLIGNLSVLDGSTLFVSGSVNLLSPAGGRGNLTVNNATLSMQNGSPTDVFNVGNLTLNSARLAIDMNPQQNLSDLINAAGVISPSGANTISVNLLTLPNLSGLSVIALAPISGEIAPTGGTPSDLFSVDPASPLAALFNFNVITGPDGGLYLVVSPTADAIATLLEPRAAIDSQPIETVTNTVYDILNDAVLTHFNLLVSANRADAAPSFGIYASGQAAYVSHDGFNISGGGFSGQGPGFSANDFSLAASMEMDVAQYYGFDQTYGLDVGVFGGYASSAVELDPTNLLDDIGSGDNNSGMIGSYGLFRSGTTYGLVSATGFFGNTDITNGLLNSTGAYDTSGVAVTGSAGHVYKISDDWRFDLRGGLVGVYFEGDSFEDSQGNDFGRSTISFGAVKFEPGFFAQYQMENGRILSPYVRLDLQQRFGYENESSLEGVDFFFDDADFSAALSAGANYQISEKATFSTEVRSKYSEDSTSFAGKIGIKARF